MHNCQYSFYTIISLIATTYIKYYVTHFPRNRQTHETQYYFRAIYIVTPTTSGSSWACLTIRKLSVNFEPGSLTTQPAGLIWSEFAGRTGHAARVAYNLRFGP